MYVYVFIFMVFEVMVMFLLCKLMLKRGEVYYFLDIVCINVIVG